MNDINIIKSLFSGKNVSINQVIGKGEVNRVYVVEVSHIKVVVRLNREDELARFTKEAWCVEQAVSLDIPSPKLLRIGSTGEAAYMVLAYVAGKNGEEVITDKDVIWHTIGAYARKINSIKTSGFSENMTSPGVFSDTWNRYLTYNIDSLNSEDALIRMGVLTQNKSKTLKERFRALWEQHFTFGLIHGDLSFANVIVEDEVVTLIDWGVAESTIVPHMEIVDLLQNQMTDTDPLFYEFLSGYGMEKSEYELIKPDIETLALLQAVDKLRWAIDRSPESIEKTSQKLKSLLNMKV